MSQQFSSFGFGKEIAQDLDSRAHRGIILCFQKLDMCGDTRQVISTSRDGTEVTQTSSTPHGQWSNPSSDESLDCTRRRELGQRSSVSSSADLDWEGTLGKLMQGLLKVQHEQEPVLA